MIEDKVFSNPFTRGKLFDQVKAYIKNKMVTNVSHETLELYKKQDIIKSSTDP